MHFRVPIRSHGKCFNIPPFLILCSMMKEGNRVMEMRGEKRKEIEKVEIYAI